MRRICVALSGMLLALQGIGATVFDVTAFGANGRDGLDDAKAIQAALDQAKTAAGEIEVRVPAGTYRVASTLCIFSNTRLVLAPDATMLRQGPEAKLLLVGAHLRADGSVCPADRTCTHGGYTQLSNVTIQGGTWDAGGSATDVTGAVQLRHGENITISAARFEGCTEHVLNLSATRHVHVTNASFGAGVVFTGKSPEFWSGFSVGDPSRFVSIEAIHLDAARAAGEPSIYPQDGTPCQDVTVEGCTFEGTFAGVGNHHVYDGTRSAGLTVTNSLFSGLRSHAVHAHGFADCRIVDNEVVGCAGLVFGRACSLNASRNVVSVTSGHGVSLSDGSACTLSDNTFAEVGGHGVYIEGGSLAMKNNELRVCELVGVRAKGIAADSAIVGNRMFGVQGVGVQLTGSKWVSVSSNEIFGSGGQSILLSATTNCTVSANVISDPQAEGISFRASIGGRINRNVVTGARGVALRVGGSDTTVTTANIVGNDLESIGNDGWDLFAYIMSGGTVTDNVCRGRGPCLRDPTLAKITYRPANATGVDFDPMGVADVAVTWDCVPYAKGYVVEYATKKDFADAQRVEIADGAQNWCELEGLSSAAKWYFRVLTVQVIAGTRYESAGTAAAEFEKAATYAIRFHSNDGSGRTRDVAFVYGEKTPLPYLRSELGWSRDGYVFRGWATQAVATKVWKADHAVVASPVAAGGMLNVHALWEVDASCYTVSFDANGGTGEMPDQLGFRLGTGRALASNAFTRDGFLFAGWSRTPTAAKAAYADGAKIYTPNGVTAGATLTLYAVWAVDPACYTVSFDANGGTGRMPDQRGFVPGVGRALVANGFVRDGFLFRGWARNPWNTSASYADGALLYSPNGIGAGDTLKLYAVWAADPNCYTIRFAANGGDGTMPDQCGFRLGVGKALAANAFTRDGYVFGGWARAATATKAAYADGAKVYTPSGVTAGSVLTLYAVWAPDPTTSTVSFDANGGVGKMPDVPGYRSDRPKQIPANVFARGWYQFAGWSLNPSATQAEYGDQSEFVVPETVAAGTPVTLYAVWERDPWAYAMAFVANGGTGSMPRQAGYSYGQPKRINACRFTRPGYRFLGWGTYPTATTAAYADGAIISRPAKYAGYASCCTITLYAIWEPESPAARSVSACRAAPQSVSAEVLRGELADGVGTYLLTLPAGAGATCELAVFTAGATRLISARGWIRDDRLILSDAAGEALALVDLATGCMLLLN